ncbi:hypothetical protein WS58_01290 [Burkholderia pseudomultivorans]|uniref:hypothetical protein n=1 Tax=Burkholderia pseudomultivorans TaxID=1207504 RepID=UPI00075BC293|nr:hypothetical protein [Burkholderia pseudomultivorans]KVC41101.1 hypothetical protein WS58_01290 [Burkholderia pseudomultivorans]KWE99226.1 hypothetical protein WT55_04530 [Burkholderia pseudomultivorans]
MKHLGPIAASIMLVFAATSLPTVAAASPGGASPVPAAGRNCVPAGSSDAARQPGSPAKPPSIRVCVSDSNTQLNLPWFLTDVIDAVNTRQSPGALLHRMRQDF